MSNLFSALSTAKSETLAMQLALLENVNTSNALLPSAQAALKWGAKAINGIGSLFDKGTLVDEPLVVELKDRVRDAYAAHKSEPASRLLQEIRRECRERAGMNAADSDTLVSVKMIDEAAAFYDIGEWLTPGEKAEAVSRRHQEESLGNLRKMVANMSPKERTALEHEISGDLASLPHEQREAIQRDMNLDTLSGKSLTNALLAAGGPLASISALSAAGFGAYLALTTIIHAVATTVLGITLPFAVYTTATSTLSLLTGPVGWIIGGLTMMATWYYSERKLSRSVYAGIIASASGHSASPSAFVPPSTPLDPTNTDRAAEAANALELSASNAQIAVIASDKRISIENGRLIASESARRQALQTAEERSSKLQSPAPLSADAAVRLRAEKAEAENIAIGMMIKEEESQAEIKRLKAEKTILERQALAAKAKLTSFEDGESSRLLEFWALHFPKMTFNRQPATWVVHKPYRDRLSLEKKLMELHNSDDPVALSRGKLRKTGEHHLKFRLGEVECRMNYRVEGTRTKITQLGTNEEMH